MYLELVNSSLDIETFKQLVASQSEVRVLSKEELENRVNRSEENRHRAIAPAIVAAMVTGSFLTLNTILTILLNHYLQTRKQKDKYGLKYVDYPPELDKIIDAIQRMASRLEEPVVRQ